MWPLAFCRLPIANVSRRAARLSAEAIDSAERGMAGFCDLSGVFVNRKSQAHSPSRAPAYDLETSTSAKASRAAARVLNRKLYVSGHACGSRRIAGPGERVNA